MARFITVLGPDPVVAPRHISTYALIGFTPAMSTTRPTATKEKNNETAIGLRRMEPKPFLRENLYFMRQLSFQTRHI